ncbi:MAG TPA: hypothetical protein PKK91_09315, partial [bacterium]|nr:hypothetical protein [bacterium]
VIKPDAKLINILRSGNLNYVCYHWHDIREDLLPYVLRLGIDILEPVITTIEVPMTIAKIRKITGPNITLMGGPAIEDIEFRSSYEIAELCRDSIVQNGRSTKFVLIPSDVPSSIPLSPQTEENLLAMINTANNFTAII